MIKLKAPDSICIRLRLGRLPWPEALMRPVLPSDSASALAPAAGGRAKRPRRTVRVS